MKINNYLDSTYLKTAEQATISEQETQKRVESLIKEAIEHKFKLVMIRPQYASLAKQIISNSNSKVLVGTVIGFHKGTFSIKEKLAEAKKAIASGADELDFVINYTEFLNKNIDLIKEELIRCTKLVLDNKKVIKWIIEVAALSNNQIIEITQLIKNTILENFDINDVQNVFVKSSTGFYKTKNNKPNGATYEAMQLIIAHAKPLKIKAAGGIKSYEDAIKMITLGVSRIGTSSATIIAQGGATKKEY